MAYVLLGVVLLSSGCCVMTSEALHQLVQSERSWCLMRADWTGTLRISGTGLRAGRVSCTADGMAVEAAPD